MWFSNHWRDACKCFNGSSPFQFWVQFHLLQGSPWQASARRYAAFRGYLTPNSIQALECLGAKLSAWGLKKASQESGAEFTDELNMF